MSSRIMWETLRSICLTLQRKGIKRMCISVEFPSEVFELEYSWLRDKGREVSRARLFMSVTEAEEREEAYEERVNFIDYEVYLEGDGYRREGYVDFLRFEGDFWYVVHTLRYITSV